MRTTRQREAIRAVFAEHGRPLGTEEVWKRAKRKVRRLGIATVYRNLKTLQAEGWLVPVVLPGETPLYERAGLEHHHHFHCRACDRVLDVVACPKDLKRLAPKGSVLEGHELVLYGLCRDCVRTGKT